MSKLVLVTGASSGIGRAIALRLAQDGHRVFGTARTPTQECDGPVTMLAADVRDDASVRACAAELTRRAGPLDVLVNCAGTMCFGPIEEVELARARDLFETNFWGVARMTRAFLPAMRERRAGMVLIVGSIAGNVAVPLNGFYAASKHALAGFSDALRHELLHLGVQVTLIEPGDYKTNLWRDGAIAGATIPDYFSLRARVLAKLETMLAAAPPPTAVAECVARVIALNATRARYPVGRLANVLPTLRALMPGSCFDKNLRKNFGIDLL
jgi:short-subunit dehydrogenase